MLTPIDVHFLVGLLTYVSQSKDVEFEFGDMVFDVAAEEERDVDITITYKNLDGTLSAFVGIEVNKRTRKLGSTDIEQLWAKLNDMPSVTQKAIVSASGYTKPAIKKAKYHNVELFHLLPWNGSSNWHDAVRFSKDFSLVETLFRWKEPLGVEVKSAPSIPLEILQTNPRIYDSDGNDLPNCKDLETWVSNQAKVALSNHQKELEIIQPGESREVELLADGNIYIETNESNIFIERVVIKGLVECINKPMNTEFKMLIKDGETDPYVGCVITELPNKNLAGFAIAKGKQELHWINIPIADRLKKKIYRQKL